MVLDHHYVAHREHVVEAAPGVGGDKRLHPDQLHDPDGHGGLPERVPLVGVEPALHDQDRHSIEVTQEETADVALHGGPGEPGNLLVREDVRVLDKLRQSAY